MYFSYYTCCGLCDRFSVAKGLQGTAITKRIMYLPYNIKTLAIIDNDSNAADLVTMIEWLHVILNIQLDHSTYVS